MRERFREKLNNRGSAMLVAIIVSMIVIAFGFSLLLVSYSLFAASVRQSTQTQCREMAKSISTELEHEITAVPPFHSYWEQTEAKAQGKYSLWFYLRENMSNEKWPFYGGPTVGYHTEKDAFRYFDLDLKGDSSKYLQMADDISICMYWSPEDAAKPAELDSAVLTISVTCTKGEQTCTIVSDYTLRVTDGYVEETGENRARWEFKLEERE